MKRIYFTHDKEASLIRRIRNTVTRSVTGAAMTLFPGITTRVAERMLCVTSPPRRKLGQFDFRMIDYDVHGHRIKVHHAGNFNHSVLFVHGWSGSSADFNAFYQPVLDAGFNIVAIDHVGHGASLGKVANMFLFVRAIEQVMADKSLGIHAVVSHSMGASAVINALKAHQVSLPIVLISPVIPFFESLYESVDNFGISTKWVDQLLTAFESRYDRSIDEIDPKVTIQQFNNPVLTIQDRQDRYISLDRNKQYFTPHLHASLHETDGLGHFKILGAAEVVQNVQKFLRGVNKL